MKTPTTPKHIGWLALLGVVVSAITSVRAAGPDTGQFAPANQASQHERLQRGAAIYTKQCLECHGDKGQGVEGAYEKPLAGDRSLDWLAQRIEKTMPEGEEEKCVGEDAAAVAVYLHEAFYLPSMQAKRTLQHLTVEQHRQSLADLVATFRKSEPLKPERGLWTQVYHGREMNKKTKPIAEEVAPTLDATYTPEHPLYAQFHKLGHSVRWSGSLLAPETGEYEIVVRTDTAMRLWFNDGQAVGGVANNEISDYKSVAFFDGWLQSDEKTEFRKRVFLLAGRAYPLMLEFSAHNQGVGNKKEQEKQQSKKTSKIKLQWVPPGGVEAVIPQRHLSPQRMPEVHIASAPFPPDDASMGFITGAAVSEAWLDAATKAAIQTADHVVANLDELVGTNPKAKDRRHRVMRFCRSFVERAFRRPISDEENKQYVARHFADWAEIKPAVKRVVLSALISPRFLYPTTTTQQTDAFDTASRLALALWDGLPDTKLWYAAADGELNDPTKRLTHARRMLDDPRAKAKLMRFFHHWLELERAEYADKDKDLFPEFDEHLLADLRTSLDLFIEHAVFSERSDYRELLLADYLYVNDRLAEVYGIGRGDSAGKGFTLAKAPADRRSGLITHPYLLTAFAYHNSTSPIHRGVFLTRNIIGRPLNPPPNAIAFEDTKFDPSMTMREKVTAFTRDSACMSCHQTINPLGFSLEHYDSIGRWRAKEKDRPINAESDFTGDDGEQLKLKGARDVAAFAVGSTTAQQGFVRQLFQHSVNRDPSVLGADALDRLTKGFEANGYHIRELFMQIALEAATQRLNLEQGAAGDPAEPTRKAD